MTDKLLVDTSVLLEDPDVLLRIFDRGGIPILSNTILHELDFNKNGNKEINKKARYLFRELTKSLPVMESSFPDGISISNDDVLTSIQFFDKKVYILARRRHQTRINNDHKIIEVAQDYGCIILTRDKALCLQAETLGVKSVIWTGAKQQKEKNQVAFPKPFALPQTPSIEVPVSLNVKYIPKVGDEVSNGNGRKLILTKEITSGGEGVIYETDAQSVVCKIYKQSCLTNIRREKIELMLSRPIHREGLCWPLDISFNKDGEFVGYVMPKAAGKPIQSTMFVKPVLHKNFPNWQRRNLVDICLQFLRQVEFLHQMNIIIGDINPLNLLLSTDGSKLWLVDTDSFQIEAYPCPVGTVNFTAPEIQGIDYATFMRTKEHEAFSVATMLFMILHPGKSPYSQQGGGSPGENIKKMEFPYGHKGETTSRNVPQGPWFYIWNNLTFNMKDGFYRTFRENNRLSTPEWIQILNDYNIALENNRSSNELFPQKIEIHDGVDAVCSKCNSIEKARPKYLARLESEKRKFFCASCTQKSKMDSLVRRSQEANATAMNGGATVENKAICTKCSASETASQRYLSSLQEKGKTFLCKKCITYLQANIPIPCNKCGKIESTSQNHLDSLHSKGKNFLCRNCVAEIKVNIQPPVIATCNKCSASDTTSQKWLDSLRAKGKNFLCRKCVSEIQSKRQSAQSVSYVSVTPRSSSVSNPSGLFSFLSSLF